VKRKASCVKHSRFTNVVGSADIVADTFSQMKLMPFSS